MLHLANAGVLAFEFADDEKENIALGFERVLRELARRGRCLLILDNVSNPSLLQPEDVDRLPRRGAIECDCYLDKTPKGLGKDFGARFDERILRRRPQRVTF